MRSSLRVYPVVVATLLTGCSPGPVPATAPPTPAPARAAPTPAAPTASAPAAAEEPVVALPCREVIDSTDAPPVGWTTVLDAVAFHAELPSGNKVPMLVRAGTTVDLALPKGSPHRFDYGWSSAPSTRLHVPACRGVGAVNAGHAAAEHASREWVVFVGSLQVSEPSCVEILVRAGERHGVIRIGIGTSCPAIPAATLSGGELPGR